MAISAVSSSITDAVSSPSSSKNLVTSKDDFLKLLLAQMENQDPLEPQDVSKFTDQMTQFGQLEQLFNVNDSLASVLKSQTAVERAQAVGMIGRQVSAQSSQLEIPASGTAKIGFNLTSPAEDVKVEIKDLFGNTVRTVHYSDQGSGTSYQDFDGLDDNGAPLYQGSYVLSMSAESASGTPVLAIPVSQGLATGVDFSSGETVIKVGNSLFTMDEIISIDEA